MCSGLLSYPGYCINMTHSGPVGTVRRKGVVHISCRQQSGVELDFFAGNAVWVSAAVPPLVVP